MQSYSAKTERTYLRLLLGILGGLGLIVLLSWGGCATCKQMQERRLLRRATAYLSGGDLKAAGLSARRAIQINPDSAGAARMMAEIGEKSGERNAVDWRRKALELGPKSAADAIALATSALEFKELKIAEKALASVDKEGQQTADYHAARAGLAEAQGAKPQAREWWLKAVQLAPENKTFQLQLALSRLALPDPEERAAGRSALDSLRRSPEQRAAALRALIFDGIAHQRETSEVRAWAEQLQAFPEATFRDRTLFLEVLRRLNDPSFVSYLTQTQAEAARDSANLAILLDWMNENAMGLLAIDFARTLPPELTTSWPIPFLLAGAHARLSDWGALESLTRHGNWGQYEFLRRAFLARALRATDQAVAAEREWAAATKEASTRGEALLSLARTVSDWGWGEEIIELLWTLTKFPARGPEALSTLYNYYAKTHDTQGLYRVFLRMAERNPNDLNVQNNLAQTSLLLGAEPERARKLAAEIYEKEPGNPVYVSTYAFALFSTGDAHAALQAMSSLSEGQLRQPLISPYYGIFLASAGDVERARFFLELGARAALLPEEKALIEQARKRLQLRALTGASGS